MERRAPMDRADTGVHEDGSVDILQRPLAANGL